MSNILDDYMADKTAPKALKEKVMTSARILILAKDIGELFSVGLQETGKDVANSLDDSIKSELNKSKNKKNE